MHIYEALEIGLDCGLRLVGEAILNIEIHATQLFLYSEIENELQQLYAEWNTVKLNSDFSLNSKIEEVLEFLTDVEKSFKDEPGGIHDEGMGWNPNNVFCGECSNLSCVNCPNKDKKKVRSELQYE